MDRLEFKLAIGCALMVTLLMNCSINVYLSNGALRPKNPKFSILKEEFATASLLNTEYLYTYSGELKSENSTFKSYIGFYPDGRMILLSVEDSSLSKIDSLSSWENASRIGYWRAKGANLKYQYYEQYGGGTYIDKKAIIKKDTIIISNTFPMLIKKEIRYDTLVLSNYKLQ